MLFRPFFIYSLFINIVENYVDKKLHNYFFDRHYQNSLRAGSF